jgi:hypothetical protein
VVKLTSTTTDKTGIYLTLTETGAATGDYRSNQANVKEQSDQTNYHIGAANAEKITAASLTDPTRTVQITIGQAAPPAAVTLTQPATDDITEKEVTLKWSKFTGGDFDSYRIYVSKSANVTTDSYMIKKISSVNTVTTTITGLSPKMQYYFKVFVFTAAGTSAGSNEITVTTLDPSGDDTTPPPAPVITDPSSSTITVNITPYKIKGTCDSADTDEILVNMQTSGVTYTSGQPSWEAMVTLKEGVNKIEVTARDADDNESAPAVITITLDTSAPMSPVILQPNNGNNFLTALKTITLEGITPLETKTLLVNSSTSEVTYTPGETVWTAIVTLSEGVNTIYVKARDEVGNDSLPATIVITLDSTPPGDPVFTNPNKGYDFITGTSPVRLYGECDPTSQEVRINGKSEGVSYTPGGSQFSVEMALAEGLNTFTVQCTDHLGTDTATDILNIIYYSQVPEKWFDEKIFSNILAEETKVDAAVAENEFHAVWSQEINRSTQIFYKSSLDSLTTLEPTKQLTNSSGTSADPHIAVDSSRIFITWTDERDSNKEIYFKRSFDKGITWSEDIRITSNSAASHSPEICLTSSGVHLIWVDNTPGDSEVFYIKSTDWGTSWSTIKQLTQISGNSSNPRIYEHDNIIYLVWQDDRNGYPDLYMKKSDDHGNTWSDEMIISTDDSVSQNPDFTVDNNGIHVVWEDNRISGDMEIYYMRSPDFGQSWGTEVCISSSTGVSSSPKIGSNGINLFVCWQDNASGSNEIMFRRTSSSGTNWESPESVTSTGKNSKFPALVHNNRGVHLFWWDTRSYENDEYGHLWTKSWATFAPRVVINELQFSDIAQIELFNSSRYSVHMDNWQFKTGSLAYTFPGDYFMSAEAFIVLHEGNGADSDTDKYLKLTIPWTQNSGGHCYILDATSTPYDFVRWGVDTTSPPSGTNWLGANPVNPAAGKNLGRNFISADTDFSSDWTAQNPSMGSTNYDDSGNAVLSVQTAKSSSAPFTGFWESKLHDGSKVFNSEFATRNSSNQVIITLDLGSDYLTNRIIHYNDGQFGGRAVTIEYSAQAAPDNWYPLVSGELDFTADKVNTDTFTFADTIARHFRFTYTLFNDPAWFQIAEIEIWGQDTGAMGSAKLNPVSAVSSIAGWPGYGADKLINGTKTYNSDFAVKNSSQPLSITIDLGSDCAVDKISHYNDGIYGAKECVLKYAVSSEPETWKTSNNYTNLNITEGQPASSDFIINPPVTAQYLKFEYSGASFNNPFWFQLNEIEVYGTTGATSQTQVNVTSISSSVTPYPGYAEDKLHDGSKIHNSEFALKIPANTVTNPVFLVCDLSDDLTISKINFYNDGEYGGKNVDIQYSTSSDPDSWALLGTYTLTGTAGQVNLSSLNFTAFTARFVKFTFKTFYDPAWFQVCELEFFGLGGTAVTYVKEPVSSASSNITPYSGYGADQLYNSEKVFNSDYAVDHNSGPVVIELDLGADKQICRLKHYNDGQYGAKSVTLEYSANASPGVWSPLDTFTGLRSIAGTPSLDTFDFSKTTLRKIRLTYTDFYDARYFQLNELEAYSQTTSSKALSGSGPGAYIPLHTYPAGPVLLKPPLTGEDSRAAARTAVTADKPENPIIMICPVSILFLSSSPDCSDLAQKLATLNQTTPPDPGFANTNPGFANTDPGFANTDPVNTDPVNTHFDLVPANNKSTLLSLALSGAFEALIVPDDFENLLEKSPLLKNIRLFNLVKLLFSNSRLILRPETFKNFDTASDEDKHNINASDTYKTLYNKLFNLRNTRFWELRFSIAAPGCQNKDTGKGNFDFGTDLWEKTNSPVTALKAEPKIEHLDNIWRLVNPGHSNQRVLFIPPCAIIDQTIFEPADSAAEPVFFIKAYIIQDHLGRSYSPFVDVHKINGFKKAFFNTLDYRNNIFSSGPGLLMNAAALIREIAENTTFELKQDIRKTADNLIQSSGFTPKERLDCALMISDIIKSMNPDKKDKKLLSLTAELLLLGFINF